jgi:hypothetical protein
MTTVNAEKPGFHWNYVLVSTGVAIVGTFVWAVAYGLVVDTAYGTGPLLPWGKDAFTGFSLGLYALYGALVGSLVAWRAPEKGALYAAIVSVAYALVFFRAAVVPLAFYAAPAAICGMLFGAAAWALRVRVSPPTGD